MTPLLSRCVRPAPKCINLLDTVMIIPGKAFGVAGSSVVCSSLKLQTLSPGYSYDNPGESVWSFRLEQTTDDPAHGPRLFHTHETRWYAPCDGHPIGTERSVKVLERGDR